KAIAMLRDLRRRFCSSVRTIPFSAIVLDPVSAEQRLAEKAGEEDEEVKDREGEEFFRGLRRFLADAGAEDAHRKDEEHRAYEESGGSIDHAAEAEEEGRGAERHEDQRIDQNLAARFGLARDDRQHGHAGLRIVLRFDERERPEMRRRPEEDNEEERDR